MGSILSMIPSAALFVPRLYEQRKKMLSVLKGQLAPAVALSEEKEARQRLRIIDERTGTCRAVFRAQVLTALACGSQLRELGLLLVGRERTPDTYTAQHD